MNSIPIPQFLAQLVERRLLDLADPRRADVQRRADFLQIEFLDEIKLKHQRLALRQFPDILGKRALERLPLHDRSKEHTSELQSLMRISYAVFCLKKKKT